MAELVSIVLAAGEGKRMRSQKPKVLHEVAGLPIVSHVVGAARAAGSRDVAVITGPGHGDVRDAVRSADPDATFFEQLERKGTAHAAAQARPLWEHAQGYVAVVYADHPLLRAENFQTVLDRLDAGMDAAILGFEPDDPTGYGRLLTDGDSLLAIREQRDASEEEKKVGLCNACILAFRAEVFRALIDKVGSDNAQNEFYVTDLVELANAAGYRVGYGIAPEVDVMGVNDRIQLARAEGLFQKRIRSEMMHRGVTLIDPDTVYFAYDTEIENDVVIEPSVYFGTGVTIEQGATIHAFSHIEGASVGRGASVGPFARLRPAAQIGADAKIGNFVEIKKAEIGRGTKVSHLSYIGDASLGDGVNVGAGAITVNYDGYNKHQTKVGAGAFIGSNTSLIAPVSVGAGALVAAGSVITKPVDADALALARAGQVNKSGRAKTIFERAAKAKAEKSRG
ncbi:bifunctional protein GlmU [Devosia pacifica]|uniref:Bifunctional protein GlmU n=1 Tax=Devosia pacifica TaxID=1335967 RepID=A0A918RUA6_9HYPH|nr:bifunctional UDP-N-acetylglucosamine diphosphorylase/glucosamine-1-phosphate N-acetyltransferase GlmU [Devosia pacifica]GHA11431.1 bifunctional protein GlmU [Devosia pacifica]